MIIVQLDCSPPAFCSMYSTFPSPSSPSRVSLNPSVAVSRDSCLICWQMPTRYWASPGEELSAAAWPQAERDASRRADSAAQSSFFFIFFSLLFLLFPDTKKQPRLKRRGCNTDRITSCRANLLSRQAIFRLEGKAKKARKKEADLTGKEGGIHDVGTGDDAHVFHPHFPSGRAGSIDVYTLTPEQGRSQDVKCTERGA